MLKSIENVVAEGPYSDIQSHNIILQVKGDSYWVVYYNADWQEVRQDLINLTSIVNDSRGNSTEIEENTAPSSEDNLEILASLEVGEGSPMYTQEYYRAIRDNEKRKQAYKSVTVSSAVLDGEDAEISENPFKFLNLPEDATFGQTRNAWIRLSKMWHPDVLCSKGPEELMKFLDGSITNSADLDELRGRIKSMIPPKILSEESFNELTHEQQIQYQLEHRKYELIQEKRSEARSSIIEYATNKMVTINKAYEKALERFSDLEKKSFAGFEWRRDIYYASWGPSYHGSLGFDALDLEGPGQIRREVVDGVPMRSTYLGFDFGETYYVQGDYKQKIPLRSFFAWMDLTQNNELSISLLEDMVKRYKLDANQTEQLRLMMINREDPDFIIDSLSISHKDEADMICFIGEVYTGPKFVHTGFREWECRHFKLGVEITPNGRLILKYESQDLAGHSWRSELAEAQFTNADLQIMQTIAYGPLLQ